MTAVAFGAAVLVAYLLGALPFGLLIGRLIHGVDLRSHGSGRTGTTNALRTLGPAAAALVLALDLGKGVAAVLVTRLLVGSIDPAAGDWAAAAAGVAAVIGHVMSVFIGFRGGRGVATTAGALVAIAPIAMAIIGPPALAIMWFSRYVSLGSVLGSLASPLVVAALMVFDLATAPALAYAIGSSVVVIVAHRDNIARLRAGTERKIGQREEVRADA